MEDYIYDGEIHSLSNDFAYILKKIEVCKTLSGDEHLKEIRKYICKKYIEYLYTFGKDDLINILTNEIMNSFSFIHSSLNGVEFIYKPPSENSPLNQYATMALKFKRFKNDGLNK